MEWFVYLPFVLERNCEHLETVENTAKWYSSEGLGNTSRPPHAFEKAWADGQLAALAAGWDGGNTGPPLVFWVPSQAGGFQHAFTWRQGDGTGILVSPIMLPHLETLRQAASNSNDVRLRQWDDSLYREQRPLGPQSTKRKQA